MTTYQIQTDDIVGILLMATILLVGVAVTALLAGAHIGRQVAERRMRDELGGLSALLDDPTSQPPLDDWATTTRQQPDDGRVWPVWSTRRRRRSLSAPLPEGSDINNYGGTR